jgi:NDP-sugar pyrophosphorylase family protein
MLKLIVLLSGRGKRFIDAGYGQIKPLLEVDGKPMIDHVVRLFPGIPNENVIFACNEKHLAQTELSSVLRRIKPHAKILALPEQYEGPAKVVQMIRDEIQDDDEVIISYCDYGTKWDFIDFLEAARQYDGMVACYTGFHPHMLSSTNYAYCRLDSNQTVAEIREKKPFTDSPMNEYASNGTYYFRSGADLKRATDALIASEKKVNGEYYVSMIYNHLIGMGGKVGVFQIEKMLQWGTPYDLEVYKKWSHYFNTEWTKTEYPSDTCLILPMAGHGSRFSERGYRVPKPLLPVDGSPMIIKAVENLPVTKNQVFIALQSHVDKHNVGDAILQEYPSARVVSLDKTTEGQACTCMIGVEYATPGQPILISACDNGVRYNQEAYQELLKEDPDVIVWGFTNNPASKNNPDMYSWIKADVDGNIQSVSCKKFPGGDPLKQYAIIGTFYFKDSEVFQKAYAQNVEGNIRTGGEFFVDDIISRCIEMGLKVRLFGVDDYICWGTPEDYETYNYWKECFAK